MFPISGRHERVAVMADKLIKERKALKFRNEIRHNLKVTSLFKALASVLKSPQNVYEVFVYLNSFPIKALIFLYATLHVKLMVLVAISFSKLLF